MSKYFVDVPDGDYYTEDADRLFELGLLAGVMTTTGSRYLFLGLSTEQSELYKRLVALFSRFSFKICLLEGKILERILPAVLTIHQLRPDGKTAQGTGFYISPDLVVTAKHVVAEGGHLTGISDYTDLQDLAVVGLHPSVDCALLRATKPSSSWMPLADGAYQGQHIAVIGTPIGQPYNLTQGVISHMQRATDPISDPNLLETDAAINPGNSGGPMVNGNGEIVGLVVSKIEDVAIEGMSFCLRVEFIRELLKLQGIEL